MHGPEEQHLRLTSHRLMYVHTPKQGHIHTLNICTYTYKPKSKSGSPPTGLYLC